MDKSSLMSLHPQMKKLNQTHLSWSFCTIRFFFIIFSFFASHCCFALPPPLFLPSQLLQLLCPCAVGWIELHAWLGKKMRCLILLVEMESQVHSPSLSLSLFVACFSFPFQLALFQFIKFPYAEFHFFFLTRLFALIFDATADWNQW